MGLLDKLLFWRKDDSADYEIDGCFTLPGTEQHDGAESDDACAVPPGGHAADSEA